MSATVFPLLSYTFRNENAVTFPDLKTEDSKLHQYPNKRWNAMTLNDILKNSQPFFQHNFVSNQTYIETQNSNCEADSNQTSCVEIEKDDEIYADNLNFNVSNKKYIPPPFSRKNFLIPKVFSSSLAMKFGNSTRFVDGLEYGISETLKYKTQFPGSIHYDRVCSSQPPYVSPLLIVLLEELDKQVPPLVKITAGSSQETIESADALFSTMLRINIKDGLSSNVRNIYLYNVPVRTLTNTLHVFLQRLEYPLFLATREFCDLVTSNLFNIRYTHFGCINLDKDDVLYRSLARCLAISSNYQVANLAYFIERCQRWVKHQIKYELDLKPLTRARVVFEESVATIAMVFGKMVVGIPRSYVAYKIMEKSLPLVDEIRRTIFYFLLGIPPFEFWHMWSINTLCFEDHKLKSKAMRGAFMVPKISDMKIETLPQL